MPNYWSRFTHFHSIRSHAPPISHRPRRRFYRADLSPADLSPTAPPLRALRLAGLAALIEICISTFCHALCLPTLPPPHLRAFFISAAPWNFVSIFWYPPSRRTALSVSQDSQVSQKLAFPFFPPPACRPFRRRSLADLAADQSHTKKRISIFCYMTPRRATAPRSPSRRTRRSRRNLHFHFLPPPTWRPFRRRTFARFYLSSPLEFRFHFLVSAEPPNRALRLTGLAGLAETCVSIFSTARLPTFPPPHLRAFLSQQPLGISFPFFGIRRAAEPRSPSRRPRRPHGNWHFHFLPYDASPSRPPACRPFRRRFEPADLAAASRSPSRRPHRPHGNWHFHFCHRSSYRPYRRRFDRADLSPTAPTSRLPISHRPRRRFALSVSQDSQAHRNLHFHFLPLPRLPTFPPPLRGNFLPSVPTQKQRVCKKQSYPIVAHYTTSLLICQLLLRILLFFPANSNKTCQTVPFFRIFFIFL